VAEADNNDPRELKRRAALAKLGLAVGVAYVTPVVLKIDRARAVTPSHCPPLQKKKGGC